MEAVVSGLSTATRLGVAEAAEENMLLVEDDNGLYLGTAMVEAAVCCVTSAAAAHNVISTTVSTQLRSCSSCAPC